MSWISGFETIIVVSHDTRNDIINVLCSREMKDTRPGSTGTAGGQALSEPVGDSTQGGIC